MIVTLLGSLGDYCTSRVVASVEHHPDKERAVDLLDLLVDIGIGNINLDAEVLLPVDEYRLGKPKGRVGEGSP